jgi:hypothetical protein
MKWTWSVMKRSNLMQYYQAGPLLAEIPVMELTSAKEGLHNFISIRWDSGINCFIRYFEDDILNVF